MWMNVFATRGLGGTRGPRTRRAAAPFQSDTSSAASEGDVDAVLRLMADDVIFMVPGQQPFGKREFAATSAGMKDVRVEGRSDIRELKVLGDWAYLRNYIGMTMTPAGGAPVHRGG